MKQTVKTSRAAGQLEKMFRELNKHYFAGKLPEPIISLKKTPSAYGHITCSKVWQAGGENKYEINISSATLDRPIEETASTLLHEMVHEYCMETGIKDTSNNGVYHNRRFKEQAEAHGLTVDHHEKYGWTITSPSEELLDFIIFQGWQDIQMGERLAWSDMAGTGAGSKAPGSSQTGAPKPPKAKSSTRRWVCPKCGTIIRSTKDVRVICATNGRLRQLMEQGAFRKDLYYRLSVFEFVIPPLRERPEDIAPIAMKFVAEFNRMHQHNFRLTPALIRRLRDHDYPGNVRQLRNVIERLVVISKLGMSPDFAFRVPEQQARPCRQEEKAMPTELRLVEQQHIARVLELAGHNKDKAARMLGISKSTLWRKCHEMRPGAEDPA